MLVTAMEHQAENPLAGYMRHTNRAIVDLSTSRTVPRVLPNVDDGIARLPGETGRLTCSVNLPYKPTSVHEPGPFDHDKG